MATTTTGSPNISSLDSKIVADLCAGYFYIDVTPSVWISSGASNVQGASVKITNPVGVVIRNYISSGYDIYPPMTSVVSIGIPLIAGNYQYGTYIIDVRLTDADGTSWVISKSVNICPPDPNNKTKKEGCLSASIKGNCNDGKVVIILDQVPTYKGTISTTQVNDLTVYYPTESELTPLETTFGSFSVVLFEGQYKVIGTVCANYPYGDNVYFKIKYKVNCEKIIRCIIDECCVFAKLDELNLRLKTDCTQAEKDATSSIALDALRLLKTAQLAAECGEDPSDYIGDLEDLLGCVCTCNCNEGVLIINNAPVTDYVIEGCNTETTTVGNTKTVTINNYAYEIEAQSGSGLTVSAPVFDEDNCKYVQTVDYTSATPVVLADFYTDVSNVGTSETDLYSYTTAANQLLNNGDKIISEYIINLYDATADKVVKVYFGGTNIFTSNNLSFSFLSIKINVTIIRSSSSTARAMVNIESSYTGAIGITETDLTGIDFTATNIIKITGTASGATGGSGDITAKMGYIEFKPKAN